MGYNLSNSRSKNGALEICQDKPNLQDVKNGWSPIPISQNLSQIYIQNYSWNLYNKFSDFDMRLKDVKPNKDLPLAALHRESRLLIHAKMG